MKRIVRLTGAVFTISLVHEAILKGIPVMHIVVDLTFVSYLIFFS